MEHKMQIQSNISSPVDAISNNSKMEDKWYHPINYFHL